ncbi:MAG: hypothetical protein JXR89_05350 [Deltaproteobacteria bacterium]|nr:hypothetical protein [Deltaproteobacteria bacterium]
MKCPKCNYTSFDYLSECKKCGEALDESRLALNFKTTPPIPFTEELPRPHETAAAPAASTDSTVAGIGKQVSPAKMPGLETYSDSVPLLGEPGEDENVIRLSGLGQLGSGGKSDAPAAGAADFETLPEIDFGQELRPHDEAPAGKGFGEIELGREFVKADKGLQPVSADIDQEPGLFSELDLSEETRETAKKELPFSFSDNENEEINLKISDDEEVQTEEDCIELELDMDDDESIDQILADLEKK